jgi:hypothetical protein
MQQTRWWYGVLSGLVLLWVGGCADIRPLWKGEQSLESLTLYFSEPVEFQIQTPAADEPLITMLELAITYDQGINRSDLPLFLTLEAPDHEVMEFDTVVPLKREGEWLGIPEENEVDYTVTHIAVTNLKLEPDAAYALKIYANDEAKEKIYGVIRVTLRVYRENDFKGE